MDEFVDIVHPRTLKRSNKDVGCSAVAILDCRISGTLSGSSWRVCKRVAVLKPKTSAGLNKPTFWDFGEFGKKAPQIPGRLVLSLPRSLARAIAFSSTTVYFGSSFLFQSINLLVKLAFAADPKTKLHSSKCEFHLAKHVMMLQGLPGTPRSSPGFAPKAEVASCPWQKSSLRPTKTCTSKQPPQPPQSTKDHHRASNLKGPHLCNHGA